MHVCGQEDNLCSLQDVNPVGLPQVGHHHLQVAFPLAGEQGANAGCHLGGVQLCLLVVEVVEAGVGVQVAVVAVVAVVMGEVVLVEAALLCGALSDGTSTGHILEEKRRVLVRCEAYLSLCLCSPVSQVLKTDCPMQAEEVSVLRRMRSQKKKSFVRSLLPHLNGKTLGVMVHACHLSYGRKCKIRRLWSKSAWATSNTLFLK
jgi:hypothetical protein